MTSQAEIGNVRVRLGIDSAEFANGVRNVQSSLATLRNSLKSFAVAAAATLSVSAIGTAIKSSIDHMDELGKAAQKIGIPVDQLSKLEYAAKLADVSLDDLAGTLEKFSKSIAEVAAGGQNDAGNALRAIGVSATDAEGRLRPTTSLIEDIAEKFSVMRDSAGKTALAIALFGKSGADLIPLLNGGRAAIADASRELEQFGGVVTPEATQRAQDFNDNLTRLQTAFNSLMQEALTPILPKLVELTQALIDMTRTGSDVRQFVENVSSWLEEWGPSLSNTKRELEGIVDALRYLGVLGKKPLELNIPGGDLPTSGQPKQTKDAPRLSIVPKIKPGTLDDIYGAGKAVKQLGDDMADAVPKATELEMQLQSMADTLASTLGDAISGLISGTMSLKEAFRATAQSISQMIAQLASELIKSSILKFLAMVGTAGGGPMGFMGFGGFYADGGNLGSGKWGIAGENGPEIIHGPASITPMDKAGRGSPQMNVTVINNSSAQINTRKNSRGELEVLVEEIMSDKALRGGNKFDAAMQRGYGLRRAGR